MQPFSLITDKNYYSYKTRGEKNWSGITLQEAYTIQKDMNMFCIFNGYNLKQRAFLCS